ncbi:DUF3761 domain-containing protein [Nocardia abscessus]|uniref:DUF3761 domain-containing protein n=1 Tax=Nocardia abscessus TaxID=120957 RepID=UPI000688C461|nr:DUF3761 domain-containing protein [Nocardia abscessus]MCC3332966.1 DUF3761 domain-containing protein [Nocardia abscessus]
MSSAADRVSGHTGTRRPPARRAVLTTWLFAVAVGLASALAPQAAAAPALIACGAGEYENVDRVCVPRPEQAPAAPDGATAQCKDGTYSFSRHRTGTCSHHGGVARWLVDLP